MRTILDSAASTLRYALRVLRRNPAFAAAALLTLALGVGANAGVFAVVNGVLLRPLPYHEPDRLVSVVTRAPGAPALGGATGGIADLPESASMLVTYEQNRSFDTIGIWWAFATTVTGAGEPETVRTAGVSEGTLKAFGVQPAVGRGLVDGDFQVGPSDAVLLSYGYWQRRFGGDLAVVGRSITIDGRPRQIVGVMPRGFRLVTADPELILPVAFERSQLFLTPFNFQMIARLKPGVTTAQADSDLQRLARVWEESWSMPPGLGGNGRGFEDWRITPATRPLKDDVIGTVGSVLWVLMGTIGIVLVIACANVANLLLVRAEGRQQELAVRAALGAGTWRIVRQLLLESLWLGLIGGALGLGAAYAGVRLLLAVAPATLPRLHEISIDGRVLGFTVLVSLMSGIVFGLIPALKYGGRRLSGAFAASRTASASRERHRTRNGLVVVQVALALVLLVSSGLMIRTFQALRTVQPGFDPREVQTLRVGIAPSVAATPQLAARMQQDLVDALSALPGVTSVAFSSAMPMEGILPNPVLTSRQPFRAESDSDQVAQTRALRWSKFVSPGFFRTSGTKVLAGREYTWTDVERLLPVAIVSDNLARELWGSPAAAIGQRVRMAPTGPWRDVIGVVENVRENGVHEAPPAIVYWPSIMTSPFQAGQLELARSAAFAVRSPLAGTEGFIDAARDAVASVNGNIPIALVRTMQEVYDASMARTSFALIMLGIAGSLALVLGVIGIYGVISYVVAQRTREVGIRLALGAQRGELRRMFLRYGLTLAVIGVVIGLGAAMALMRLMRSLLFEVSPLDPLTYAAVPIVLIAAALVASYLPARRASGLDPAVALRAE